jgi:hypothetical protein
MAKDSGVPPKHAYVNVTITVIESNIEGTTQPTPDINSTLPVSNNSTTTPQSSVHNTTAGITELSTRGNHKGAIDSSSSIVNAERYFVLLVLF